MAKAAVIVASPFFYICQGTYARQAHSVSVGNVCCVAQAAVFVASPSFFIFIRAHMHVRHILSVQEVRVVWQRLLLVAFIIKRLVLIVFDYAHSLDYSYLVCGQATHALRTHGMNRLLVFSQCKVIALYVQSGCFKCAKKWLLCMCKVAALYMQSGCFVCAKWLLCMCKVVALYVQSGCSVCAKWLLCM